MCIHDHHCSGCLSLDFARDKSSAVSRRGFLAAAGASAAALQMGLLEFTSTLVAGETKPKSKPRIRVFFIRPKDQAKYWMSWPGNDYNADERQADFTARLRKIARKLDIELEVDPAALEDAATVEAALGRMKQSPPDGIFVVQMHLSYWKAATDHLLTFMGGGRTTGDASRLTVGDAEDFVAHLRKLRVSPNGHANTAKRGLLDKGVLFIVDDVPGPVWLRGEAPTPVPVCRESVHVTRGQPDAHRGCKAHQASHAG